MTGRAQAGDNFFTRLPTAQEWNDALDAGREFGRKHRTADSRGRESLSWMPRGFLKVKNNSGSGVSVGKVLEVGSNLITTIGQVPEEWVFNATTPAEDNDKIWGVAIREIPSGEIEWLQVDGLVRASVNINHVQHQWVDVTTTTTLQSKWHGNAKIVWKSTASTGTQDCLIMLNTPFWGPINGIVQSGGITAGSSGNVQVQYSGAASSPANNVTAYLNWMAGTNNAAENDEVQFFYHRDQKKYVISNMEC